MLASLTLLSVIDPLLCRELYILPCSNSSFTSLINHCCSLCSHYPYCHSYSIQGGLHPIIFVDFTAFLICFLSIFSCFRMTIKNIVLILYSQTILFFHINNKMKLSHCTYVVLFFSQKLLKHINLSIWYSFHHTISHLRPIISTVT